MKRFFIVLTIMICGMLVTPQHGYAQLVPASEGISTPEDSVRAVINTMFAAMKKADSALLKTCFADGMVLQTIGRDKEGKLAVMTEKPEAFSASISKLAPGDADEQIVFETVRVDGPLAIAWTPYKFYYKGNFNHCGVNSFQLVRFNGEWKIQYIIDTRRKANCE
jgi:hypothetical protein